MNKTKYRVIALSVGSGLFLVVMLVFGWFEFSYYGKCNIWMWPSEPFDAEKWRNTPREQRFVFVKNIIKEKKFLGAHTEEIKRKVGTPDSISNSHIAYVVRDFPDGGCGLNWIAILRLKVDPDGKVYDVLIMYD